MLKNTWNLGKIGSRQKTKKFQWKFSKNSKIMLASNFYWISRNWETIFFQICLAVMEGFVLVYRDRCNGIVCTHLSRDEAKVEKRWMRLDIYGRGKIPLCGVVLSEEGEGKNTYKETCTAVLSIYLVAFDHPWPATPLFFFCVIKSV